MQGGGFDRAASQTVEVRKRDFVAQAVILLCLHDLPVFLGIAAKAARIILAHRNIRSAMHHPARQFLRQAGTPANANLCPATAPEIAHAGCRANQRVTIRGMADRPMHLALNAKFRKDRHTVQAFFQIGHDPVVSCVKQPVFVVPWAVVMPDRVRVLFLVNPDQPAFLFHADIARYFLVVADHR